MALIIFMTMMACSNFSVLLFMRREGIETASSWKTVAICVVLVPVIAFGIMTTILMFVQDKLPPL